MGAGRDGCIELRLGGACGTAGMILMEKSPLSTDCVSGPESGGWVWSNELSWEGRLVLFLRPCLVGRVIGRKSVRNFFACEVRAFLAYTTTPQ